MQVKTTNDNEDFAYPEPELPDHDSWRKLQELFDLGGILIVVTVSDNGQPVWRQFDDVLVSELSRAGKIIPTYRGKPQALD